MVKDIRVKYLRVHQSHLEMAWNETKVAQILIGFSIYWNQLYPFRDFDFQFKPKYTLFALWDTEF